MEKKQVYFCDSVGKKPEKRIQNYIDKINKYLKNNNVDNKYNTTQHQEKDTECGVYSINFILRLLKGKNFDEIMKKKMSDDKINKCRNVYFNKNKNK